jgi:hypothetical protein
MTLSESADGRLTLPSGELYVPKSLEWTEITLEDGFVLLGKEAKSQEKAKLVVASLDAERTIDNTAALETFKKTVGKTLEIENNQLEMLDAVSAPYPWPDSLELRLRLKPTADVTSVYVGSGSGRTLLICVFGAGSEALANSTAASFKENMAQKRKFGARQGRSAHIQSMLGTGSTFLMLFSMLLPLGLTFFTNRRRGEKTNPYLRAQIGLAVGLVLSIAFDYIVLSRFSWAGARDYGEAVGSALAGGIFLLVVSGYFSRRWITSLEPGE